MPMRAQSCISITFITQQNKIVMNIYLNEISINNFTLCTSENFAQLETCKKYLISYVEKSTGAAFSEKQNAGGQAKICFCRNEKFSADEFSLRLLNNKLTIEGGERGVIYGVFAFLEKIGCRFFAADCVTLPKTDVHLADFSVREKSPFYFRDILGNSADDREWSLKNRINSCLWGKRNFTEAEGGGYDFAGIPAHSLTGEFLLAPYIKTHPEYFALIGGKRVFDRNGQACLSAEGLEDTLAEDLARLVKKTGKKMVSLTRGDNAYFCECEKCREKIEKYGRAGYFLRFVNEVAKKVKEKEKTAIIHTFAYNETQDITDFEPQDNVLVQFCTAFCRTHAISDTTCARNVKQAKLLKKWRETCGNLMIWDYVNCFKYELFDLPDENFYLKNLRFYAENGVKGVFNEGEHRNTEKTDFCGMHEMKSYLLAKAMWNPFMSEEEYARHKEEFCAAYYGAGYKNILAYRKLLYDYSRNRHVNYDCAKITDGFDDSHNVTEAGYTAGDLSAQKNTAGNFISSNNIGAFIKKANELIDGALRETRDEKQLARIEKIRTEILYYELFHTMQQTLENGTEEEKRAAIEKNSDLIDRIISQRLVLTFWGQSRESQNEELEKMRNVPPSGWNYKW